MSRLALAAAAAAALLGTGCGTKSSAAPTTTIRQPSAIAIFKGYVADRSPPEAAGLLRPYLVVANATRNDLTLLDATDDTVVESSILLRPLVLPLANRPALLAAASLGDGKADLLVAVAGGDSVLQVVETWNPGNAVHSSPGEPTQRAVDLGTDVVALRALAPDPTAAPAAARVAALLADRRVAIVTWTRQADADDSIAFSGVVQGGPYPFQPLDLAVLPDDPQSELYAATLDPLPPLPGSPAGSPPVFGVAAISPDLATFRALDARGPTRLVGALRLHERLGSSTANDKSAFETAPDVLPQAVTRVYAVLDPSGCGPTRRIDCGVVTLDPGASTIPADWAGRMPYRAPMQFPGRAATAFAVVGPTEFPPAQDPDPAAIYKGTYMRLLDGATERATTGVAAVASEDGSIYFLDLGRFESALSTSPVATKAPGSPTSPIVSPPPPPDQPDRPAEFSRLWLVAGDGSFAASPADAGATLTITPGYTPSDAFTVAWQGFLPDLTNRNGEAGLVGADVSIAMQRGEGPPADGRQVTSVVRLFHPALGVHPGDIVAIKAAGVPGCTGTDPLETKTTPATTPANNATREFEATVAELLPPTATFPGGALRITPLSSGQPPPADDPTAPDPWLLCYDALKAQAGTLSGATRLDVSVRASGLVMSGFTSGYAGRPVLGTRFALQYPADANEDALAAQCPIVDWDGSFPSSVDFTCGGTGCPRAGDPTPACERAILARKARRIQNLSWDCSDQACSDRFDTDPLFPVVFPEANGPTIAFEVDAQPCTGTTAATCATAPLPIDPTSGATVRPSLARGTQAVLAPGSGLSALGARPVTGTAQASGAISFDRSPYDPVSGYRFLVSYPSDIVVDATPSVTPVSTYVVR